MSREIKFRVWDWKNVQWHDPERFNLLGEPLFLPNYYQEFEIQQFTGLLDKNGKEIYEGDIISCLGRDFKEESRHEVKYGSGGFYLDKKDYLWYGVKHGICEDGEIIGNIFENPELIK